MGRWGMLRDQYRAFVGHRQRRRNHVTQQRGPTDNWQLLSDDRKIIVQILSLTRRAFPTLDRGDVRPIRAGTHRFDKLGFPTPSSHRSRKILRACLHGHIHRQWPRSFSGGPSVGQDVQCDHDSDFCRAGRIIRPIRYHLFTGQAHSDENPLQLENPVQPLPVTTLPAQPGNQTDAKRRELLMEKAKSLEAAFLSEMLSHAGLDAAEGAFSGGIGEEQFSSFLREAQAKAIVDRGGIGLAEQFFQSLVRKDHASE